MSTSLATTAQDLSSLDHAILLSLLAKKHCLIETSKDAIDSVAQEIELIAAQLFGLSWASVECNQDTTLEDFNGSILIATEDVSTRGSSTQLPGYQRQSSTYSISKPQSSKEYSIANVIVAKDLGATSRQVQIQALELIRTNRIFTHTAVYPTPKPFLLVVLTSTNSPPLNVHLNELLFLSHYHDPQDELPRLEAIEDQRSLSPSLSVPTSKPRREEGVLDSSMFISASSLQQLSSSLPSIALTSETRSYLMSLVIFIRTHRVLIPGSATPLATQYLELLSRCLALLHGIDFITPALVGLAARKVYRHRLRILKPSDAAWERSVMYGSKVADVKDLLVSLWQTDDGDARTEGEVAEGIIEDVVADVEVPV